MKTNQNINLSKSITHKFALFVMSLCLLLLCSTTSAMADEELSPQSSTQSIYRLYNPGLAEHLYTTDANEVKVLTAKHGWKSEGVGWTAPTSGTPVYRLYNAGLSTHLYTTDTNEVNTLCKSWGWVKDFNGSPLFYSGGNVGITRLYNPGLAEHHYTADSNEIKTITQPKWGWKNEGTKLYCLSMGSASSGSVSSNSSSNSTLSGNTSQSNQPCSHNWVAQTETVYVPNIQDVVVSEAWDEQVPKDIEEVVTCICNDCGATFTEKEEMETHAEKHEKAGESGLWHITIDFIPHSYETIHHPAVTKKEDLGYWNIVTVGYKCSLCGAEKLPGM